jgi:hypothetical protein
MNDFRELLRRLLQAQVEFILVGGVAATVHGSSRLTVDLDIVYRRTRANADRIVSALAELHPYLGDRKILKRSANLKLCWRSAPARF